ncbi:MAG: hypothetical protein AVDCRST_MAG93-9756 [uncultured Chloroflexia bacterium]|uniref:Uncharacterized protein n=1 Tax=uncultured Chloroflexia bacterium TaxID=1672391 RepID=A0A6J4NT55_9CHLR|nr:MAG: hypothetical protein AVDCRST_MAG93-9756 [uncultured Chloroflexia bacterium]
MPHAASTTKVVDAACGKGQRSVFFMIDIGETALAMRCVAPGVSGGPRVIAVSFDTAGYTRSVAQGFPGRV